MPEDTRPVSEGGNRGIDDVFTKKAPPGKFRIVSVDTFDGSDCVIDDVKNLNIAKNICKKKTEGRQMTKLYVYNDKGKCVHDAGSF